MTTTLSEILETFDFLDDWEDRYKYLIDLGKEMPDLADAEKTDANKVRGCVSQVWLITSIDKTGDGTPVLSFRGDSDALIVQGLVAIVTSLFSGKTAQDILDTTSKVFCQTGSVGAPDAAALQRSQIDGRAHPQRRARSSGSSLRALQFDHSALSASASVALTPSAIRNQLKISITKQKKSRPWAALLYFDLGRRIYLERLRCWPRPIFLASSERAAA